MERGFAVVAVAAAMLGAGCGGPSEPEAEQGEAAAASVVVSGSLTYRERMALPDGATAHVAVAEADGGAVVADVTIPLDGRQVPVPFELTLAAPELRADVAYTLSARIDDAAGRTVWATETPQPVDLSASPSDAGELWLVRAVANDSAGGGGPEPEPEFTARGNEPGWLLTIDDRHLTLKYNYGQDELVVSRPEPVVAAGERRWLAAEGGHELRVDVVDLVCRDTMSGMPYPARVSVTLDGETLHGCGGSPESLLTGGEWVVEDIAGKGIIDRSRVTLNFDPDGVLTGRAGCNTYGASYRLSGEGVAVENARATLMACSPALDAQEREFLRLLGAASRFDIADDGALVVHSAGGETILARRE